jgi:hypothetical protein
MFSIVKIITLEFTLTYIFSLEILAYWIPFQFIIFEPVFKTSITIPFGDDDLDIGISLVMVIITC